MFIRQLDNTVVDSLEGNESTEFPGAILNAMQRH